MSDVTQIVPRPPVPSVNYDGNRMRPLALWRVQFAELKFILAVSDVQPRRSRRDFENALRGKRSRQAEEYASGNHLTILALLDLQDYVRRRPILI
jgi:hypothetical protein